jgi:Cu/Zn superoxide dismutase
MKRRIDQLVWLILLSMLPFIWSSCGNDDEPEMQIGLTGEKTIFNIGEFADSGISGFMTLEEREDNSTLITVLLTGTTSGSHPYHIHKNTVVQSGDIIISLTDIDGSTGLGITEVSMENDGSPITYSELIEIDGHLTLHLSESNLSIILSFGDLGENVFTGETDMFQIEGDGIQGNIEFQERENGETLATVTITGASDATDHPNHIHKNSAAEGGSIIIDFNNVNGTSGIGITNIEQKNNGDPVSYQDLLTLNEHIRMHNSDANFASVAEGDIGSNLN